MITDTIIEMFEYFEILLPTAIRVDLLENLQTLLESIVAILPTILDIFHVLNFFFPLINFAPLLVVCIGLFLFRIIVSAWYLILQIT